MFFYPQVSVTIRTPGNLLETGSHGNGYINRICTMVISMDTLTWEGKTAAEKEEWLPPGMSPCLVSQQEPSLWCSPQWN